MSSTRLRGFSAASESSTRKRSAQAVIGRQKRKLTPITITIMTPMARQISPRLPSAVAAAA